MPCGATRSANVRKTVVAFIDSLCTKVPECTLIPCGHTRAYNPSFDALLVACARAHSECCVAGIASDFPVAGDTLVALAKDEAPLVLKRVIMAATNLLRPVMGFVYGQTLYRSLDETDCYRICYGELMMAACVRYTYAGCGIRSRPARRKCKQAPSTTA